MEIDSKNIMTSIFDISNETNFNEVALNIFKYQYKHVEVYRNFCQSLNKTEPKHYSEIPFLPISFFKTHSVLSDEKKSKLTFKSSGTTLKTRSRHEIANPEIYKHSFLTTFKNQITNPENAVILALLPNYIQQGDSSLIYMVNTLIKLSGNKLSGFYLYDNAALIKTIELAKNKKNTIVLFGVSYALLDIAEEKHDLSEVIIIETGGMKGKRKELIKEELHRLLKKGLNTSAIYSEYGMTELLSQAYTDGSTYFTSPKWMKILVRDINDPLQLVRENKTGGINVIDLANLYSCSFIATDDLGVKYGENFKVLGRFDSSDIRGCNLLINN